MLYYYVYTPAQIDLTIRGMQTLSISYLLLRSKSRISQLLEELVGESRIDKFQKLGNLLPVLCEMQDQRVFVGIRPDVTVCCTRGMHNTRMRIYIMHLCVDSNLRAR